MSLEFLLKSFGGEDPKPKTKHKDDFSLAGLLQRERVRSKKLKKPRPASENFNPSTLTYDFCRRTKVAQLLKLRTIWVDPPTPKLQFRFDLGHKIHDIIQGYFWDCELLEGEFECLKCDEKWWDISPSECSLGHKRKYLRYREVVYRNKHYHISGRCDGVVLKAKNSPDKTIVDVKSIANKQGPNDRQFCFEDLEEQGPKPAHVVQLMLYMFMGEHTDGHLFYVSTNSHQINSFEIKYDHKVIEPYLTEIEQILKLAEHRHLPAPCGRKDCDCHELTV